MILTNIMYIKLYDNIIKVKYITIPFLQRQVAILFALHACSFKTGRKYIIQLDLTGYTKKS